MGFLSQPDVALSERNEARRVGRIVGLFERRHGAHTDEVELVACFTERRGAESGSKASDKVEAKGKAKFRQIPLLWEWKCDRGGRWGNLS